jgi:hypothetical protein
VEGLPVSLQERAEVRGGAIFLFGNVIHNGGKKFQQALKTLTSQALVPLLFHLADSCPKVIMVSGLWLREPGWGKTHPLVGLEDSALRLEPRGRLPIYRGHLDQTGRTNTDLVGKPADRERERTPSWWWFPQPPAYSFSISSYP